MIEVILMKGCPGSGKSTWAKEFIATQSSAWKRVNNDLLRECFDFGQWSKGNEANIKTVRRMLIKEFLSQGFNLIVDNVNAKHNHFDEVVAIAESLNIDCTIREECVYADLQTAIDRDKSRVASVGESVVKKWWKFLGGESFKGYTPRYLELNKLPPVQQDLSNQKAIICDLDGTLCLLNGRDPYDASTADNDTPCAPVLTTVYALWLVGHDVIFMSGRPEEYREPSEAFLNKWLPEGMGWKLFMRRTGDSRKDSVVKRELFLDKVLPNYYIELVLDDRNQVVDMFRTLNLKVFQVAPGNF